MASRNHKKGAAVLDEPPQVREDVDVSARPRRKRPGTTSGKRRLPTLYEQLRPVIGIAKGLPSDLAQNHDHYLHGRPKR
ncbi:MAG: hypothetical protein FJ279_13575 [Planctomycetes bacterium]|nr:hypothetical protein [Planctomycetota bacterium]MBM4080393.1 hypothetical protein [Planctomycetota bacterium]